jgi:HPt (histidine-containing phosphotransfer) domain-containing protein
VKRSTTRVRCAGDTPSVLSDGLQAIFERNRDDFQQRVQTLDEAVAAILAGSLDEDLRAAATSDAHTLAGTLGTFGLPRGSELARQLEERLSMPHGSTVADESYLVHLVTALRRELESRLTRLAADEQLELYTNLDPSVLDASLASIDEVLAIRSALPDG